jgi:hypothetical protein
MKYQSELSSACEIKAFRRNCFVELNENASIHSLRGMKICVVLVRRAGSDRYNRAICQKPAKRLMTDQEHEQEQGRRGRPSGSFGFRQLHLLDAESDNRLTV